MRRHAWSAARLLRAWWAESRWAALVFGWWQPFRMHAVPTGCRRVAADRPAPRGVVLVHGFLYNQAFWTPWFAPLLRAAAIPLSP